MSPDKSGCKERKSEEVRKNSESSQVQEEREGCVILCRGHEFGNITPVQDFYVMAYLVFIAAVNKAH